MSIRENVRYSRDRLYSPSSVYISHAKTTLLLAFWEMLIYGGHFFRVSASNQDISDLRPTLKRGLLSLVDWKKGLNICLDVEVNRKCPNIRLEFKTITGSGKIGILIKQSVYSSNKHIPLKYDIEKFYIKGCVNGAYHKSDAS